MAFQSPFPVPIFLPLPLSLSSSFHCVFNELRPSDRPTPGSSGLCLLASISKDDVNISDSDFAAGDPSTDGRTADTDNSHSARGYESSLLPASHVLRKFQTVERAPRKHNKRVSRFSVDARALARSALFSFPFLFSSESLISHGTQPEKASVRSLLLPHPLPSLLKRVCSHPSFPSPLTLLSLLCSPRRAA